jgi:YihY family inner membrane protein
MIERMASQAEFAISNALMAILTIIPYAFSLITFTLAYLLTSPRYVPRRHVVLGAVVAALTWEIAKNAFLGYIHMTRLTSAYGSIGGIIVLMTWVYVSSAIILWGMELVAASVEQPRETVHLKRKKGVLVID